MTHLHLEKTDDELGCIPSAACRDTDLDKGDGAGQGWEGRRGEAGEGKQVTEPVPVGERPGQGGAAAEMEDDQDFS